MWPHDASLSDSCAPCYLAGMYEESFKLFHCNHRKETHFRTYIGEDNSRHPREIALEMCRFTRSAATIGSTRIFLGYFLLCDPLCLSAYKARV